MEMQEMPSGSGAKGEDLEASKELQEVKSDDKENLDEKTKELKAEAEPDHYSKLQRPQEDIYAEAFYCDTSEFKKPGKPTAETGNVRLYKAASVILGVLCLLLLLITITLAVKLQNGSGVCPVPEDDKSCGADECESVCATVQPQHNFRSGTNCYQCPHGWHQFQQRCFYLSTTRLSWELGQKNCSASRGTLAVIDSRGVQDFLTEKGNLNYWIGLKHDGVWTWVDKTELRKSYWADDSQAKGCATLRSESPAGTNWKSNPCSIYNYFICQLQM